MERPAAAPQPEHAALLDQLERQLDQIDDALRRLDDGTYGRCASCGQELLEEVLASDPFLQRCPSCATAAPAIPTPATAPGVATAGPHGSAGPAGSTD